jgi:hypothetical protein
MDRMDMSLVVGGARKNMMELGRDRRIITERDLGDRRNQARGIITPD